jgi:hypothetical protein
MHEPDLWPNPIPVAERGGPHFADLIAATRLVQDRVSGTNAPSPVIAEAAAALSSVAALLASFQGGPQEGVAGTRMDLPGRGHPFLAPVVVDAWSAEHMSGKVTLTRMYDSGGGQAHGGALPLLFVEVLGRLSNTGRVIARTAYAHTNFRQVTPIGRELRLDGTVDKLEGRKRFLSGRLYLGEVLVADADILFIEPRPGSSGFIQSG